MTSTNLEKFNQTTMSSREIAEYTGKTHDNVLKAIRAMEDAWVRITGVKFNASEYKDSTGRKLPMYELSKTETLYVATKFNDEARAKLIIRWEELELKAQKIALPQSYSEALRELADKAEENERLKIEAKENAPKILFTEAVIGSKNSCMVGELAKLITQNGYTIGQNRLFVWLRDNGYMGKRGENYNMPLQQYVEQGLFELKKGTRSGNDGVMYTTITPKVTGKGQVYFVNKFLSIEV